MTDDPLAAAAHAYLDAVRREELARRAEKRAHTKHVQVSAEVKQLRAPLAEQIVIAAKAGRRPKEIIEVTKYTPERVRQILRAAGIDPLESKERL